MSQNTVEVKGCGGCGCFLVLAFIILVFYVGRCTAQNGVTLQSPIKVESKGAPDAK